MSEGIEMDIEMLGTKELAYQITLFDWDLFWCIHEYELLYYTFGRHHFGKVNYCFLSVVFSLFLFFYGPQYTEFKLNANPFVPSFPFFVLCI